MSKSNHPINNNRSRLKPDLKEGLRRYDLTGLVDPTISVDEFKSKVSDDAIVFGFYVSDPDAAKDLAYFLQKSPVVILDIDISPAPTQDGDYLVFVEVMNDDRMPGIVADILHDAEQITKISKWKMRINHVRHLVPFTKKNLQKYIKKISKKPVKEIYSFLRQSCILDATIDGDNLLIESYGGDLNFKIVEFNTMPSVYETYLTESHLKIDLKIAAKERYISNILGEGWIVSTYGDYMLLQRDGSESVLLLTQEG